MSIDYLQLSQAQAEAGRGWTETRISVARALYNSGKSAAQVAQLIGGVSRNAVIGKIHRDALSDPQRKLPHGSTDQAKGMRQPRKPRVRARGPIIRVKTPLKEAPPPPSVIDQQIPAEQRRTLATLDNACCHWPVGDPQSPEFFFCGAPKTDDPDVPYCPTHQRRSRDQAGGRRRMNPGAFASADPGANWWHR